MIDKQMMAEVEMGESVRRFLNSDLGRYLDGVTKQDVDLAKDELLGLDPHAFTDLVKLQNEIARIQKKARIAEALQDYLNVAIVGADQALNNIEANDVEEEPS